MNIQFFSFLCIGLALAMNSSRNHAAPMAKIAPTPILTVDLPLNSTWQVESSMDGTSWDATGVLVSGSGAPVSIRLDGFPANRIYRMAAIGGSGTVAPSVSSGLHIEALSFSGTGEVCVESRQELDSGNWVHEAFSFPDINNRWIASLPDAPSAQQFFRALQPAIPLVPATISYYTPDLNSTSAGFGIVADDMPQLYQQGNVAAVCSSFFHRDGQNAAAAGECYELAGPLGKTTVMVVDQVVSSPTRTCGIGQPYFELSETAYTNLFTLDTGFGSATFRLVPAPVNGNIKMVCINNTLGYFIELRIYNHRAGVSKLEFQDSGGNWVELGRREYNSFVYNSGAPMPFPARIRVTSRFGEQVTFPSIASMSPGNRFTADGQFNIFPDQGPSPVWIVPPVYTDSLTNVLGGDWLAIGFNGVTINAAHTADVFQGDRSLRVSGIGPFDQVIFSAPTKFPWKPEAYIEFAIRSEGETISSLGFQVSGYNESGSTALSREVALPPIDNTWRTIRIPLSPAGIPARIQQFTLLNRANSPLPPFNLDAISFRNTH